MTSKPVIIITGVSSGIGLATALFFVENGWIVVGTVRRKDYPVELATAAIDVQLVDLTNPKAIAKVVQQAYRTYSRLDAVVANAGYAAFGDFADITHDQLVDQLAINTVAAADLIRPALVIMRQEGKGSIVAISSIAGRVGFPGSSAYNASKFALEGMLEGLSHDVANSAIRVRLIEPSSVKTPFWTRGVVRSAIRKSDVTNQVMSAGHKGGLSSDKVAAVVYKSVTSPSGRLHYPVGVTHLATTAKRLLPDRLFRRGIRRILGT